MHFFNKFLIILVFFSLFNLVACQSSPVVENDSESDKRTESDSTRSASPMQGITEVIGYLRLEQNNGQNFVLISDDNFKYALVLKDYDQVNKLLSFVNKHIKIKGMLEIFNNNGINEFQLMTEEIYHIR